MSTQNVSLFNNFNANNNYSSTTNSDVEVENVNIFYTTTKKEEQRTTFENTFKEEDKSSCKAGEEFLNGLIENQDDLMARLNLSEQDYETLCALALGLASQETGMGEEDGYVGENTYYSFLRNLAIKAKKGDSASSGLTQMKIYDFMTKGKLSDEDIQILKDYGIEAKSLTKNNLFKNPDKAAVATVVVLNSLAKTYNNYKQELKEYNENLDIDEAAKNDEALSKILDVFNSTDDIETKAKIRQAFADWVLSKNGSKKGDKTEAKYNEEENLEKLNKLLSANGVDFTLKQEDLDSIRYCLTKDDATMDEVAYCAYVWNNGVEAIEDDNKDRLITAKIGTLLLPEYYDYAQFSANVSSLTKKYLNQMQG